MAVPSVTQAVGQGRWDMTFAMATNRRTNGKQFLWGGLFLIFTLSPSPRWWEGGGLRKVKWKFGPQVRGPSNPEQPACKWACTHGFPKKKSHVLSFGLTLRGAGVREYGRVYYSCHAGKKRNDWDRVCVVWAAHIVSSSFIASEARGNASPSC